jgi:site-specific recombinase XerD
MTLSKLAADYVRFMGQRRKRSINTCDGYERIYGQFRAYLQGKGLKDTVNEFTPENCEGFTQTLTDAGASSNTINNKLSALSSLADWARKQKDERGKWIMDENPILRLERPPREHNERPFLYPDEIDKVCAFDDAEENELIARDLLIDTNLRASELVAVKVAQVKQHGERLVLTNVAVSKSRGSKKVTNIILSEELSERIPKWLAQREAMPTEPLLVNRSNQAYSRSSLYQVISRIAKRAGVDRVKIGTHSLARHTMNTLARTEGIDLPTRAALLNHSNTRTIEKYDHLLPDEVFEAREKVRAALRERRGMA